MRILSIVLCSLTLCVACGQKGPLYMPEEPAPKAATEFPCSAADAPCRQDPQNGQTPTTSPTNTTPSKATTESTAP